MPQTAESAPLFRQVDVSSKPISYRKATATGTIKLKPSTLKVIKRGEVEKGDPLSLARLAGVVAAKKTSDVLALCHPLRLDATQVRAELIEGGIRVTATVVAKERTGVEMEALTAVSVALLNVWDVTKQYEKDSDGQYPSTRIEGIRVTSKVKRKVDAS
ncbi:MAG TPA: cyclic pyranopterin monophosphate synthase MoaC [Nitrososphaerales archaeon]|nr:cyclic pyranopterin monophosphate synthase MoaC [Nitrososphaerales archaeon]